MPEKLSLEIMKAEAEMRGGECLSTEYTNAHGKMTFRCKQGHVWRTAVYNIREGSWCPVCSTKRRTSVLRKSREEIDALATRNGGKCLTTDYYNIMQLLEWECADGHIFHDSVHKVMRRKTFCPYCSRPPLREATNDTSEKI